MSVTSQDTIEYEKRATLALARGDTYCAVPAAWYKSVCAWLGLEFTTHQRVEDAQIDPSKKPGPYDARGLLVGEGPELKEKLTEIEDLFWLHADALDMLDEWVGGEGSVRISRRVETVGLRQMTLIDAYPVFMDLCWAKADGSVDEKKGSTKYMASSKASLKKFVSDFLTERDGDEIRLWYKGGAVSAEGKSGDGEDSKEGQGGQGDGGDWLLIPDEVLLKRLENLSFPGWTAVMADCKLSSGQWSKSGGTVKTAKDFAARDFEVNDELDARDKDGKWYESIIRMVRDDEVQVHFNGWANNYDEWFDRHSKKLAAKNTHTKGPKVMRDRFSSRYDKSSTKGRPKVAGAVGLSNLGNTCFMNSSLQCLSNTPGLSDYFVEEAYLADINKTNPMGWQGKIAEAYGNMIQDIWSGEYTKVVPSQLKKVLGEFQPRFSGYQQQDSSELLQFLLDGLHEDLNRVKIKVPTTTVESDGKELDAEVAQKSLDTYKKRNDSIVADLMVGQLKSTVICPDCKRHSVTFDPVTTLQVPLPKAEGTKLTVSVITSTSATVYRVPLPAYPNVRDLKNAVYTLSKVNPKNMLIAELSNNVICSVLRQNSKVLSRAKPKYCIYAHSDESKTLKKIECVQVVAESSKLKYFGCSLLVELQVDLLGAYPVEKLRASMLQYLAPFLRTIDGEEFDDAKAYELHVMDSNAVEYLQKIEFDAVASSEEGGEQQSAGVIDFTALNAKNSFCIGVKWNAAARKKWYKEEEDFEIHASVGSSKKKKKDGVDIFDCVELFCERETLTPNEAWYCNRCKKHQEADKKFDLWGMPDILVIQLKRFTHTRMMRKKIETFVDFPIEGLDLSEYVVNPDADPVYDLFAVSNHFGGMGGGHYTAFAKNQINGKWYDFDDATVTPISVDRVKSKAAYVLFYKRRSQKS
jgi:ubiquitin C-terminal hydrolase